MGFGEDVARSMVRRAIFAGIGLVLGLVIFVARHSGGGSGPKASELDKIPAKVFDGTLPVTIEVEVSDAADLSVHCATGNGYDVNKPKYLNASQKLPPGKSSFTILVPPQTSLEPEVHIRPPALKKGSTITLVVKSGSTERYRGTVQSESDTLRPGSAFFDNCEIENCGGK